MRPLLLLMFLGGSGCAGILPEPIYANQVDAYFPEPAADAPDDQRAVRAEAERCAQRLNARRANAELTNVLSATLSSFGGLTSGVGGVFSAIDFGDPDLRTAMATTASIGAGVTLIGNLVLGLVGNPLEELRLRGLGARSWDLAIELELAGAEPESVRAHLARCSRDEGPPARVVGSGPAFGP